MGGERMKAAIYTRISLAALGDTTKTDDQERQCRELCERRGWEVAEVFTDHSKSAWKRTVRRPGWEALLAAVADGRFGAIVTYWGDRIVRQPRDLEDLLDLREGRNITMASIAGQYDFDNKDHRMMMRWEVARGCNESDTISDRKKNQYARMRREGKVRPGGRGGRAFGFEKDGITHIPAECDIIRDAAKRLLLGESAGSIARSITMLTPAGRQFTGATVRKMLARPRLAGLMPDGVAKAAWEPVLDREEWELACAVLDAKAATFPYATNARRWLLSGIAVCGVCWTPLGIRQSKGRAGRPPQIGYGCVRDGCRKVYRSAELLDAYVTGAVVARLARPDNPQPEISLRDGIAAELASLTARREETEEFIASLVNAPARRIAVLNRALDGFDRKISELQEQIQGGARDRLLAAHAGITRAEFEGLPLDVRRALVRGCYKVVVLRSSRRGPGFREEDVILSPVTGSSR